MVTPHTLNIRLESSCCNPALTAAAACKEVEAVLEEGDGVWPRKAVPASVFVMIALDIEVCVFVAEFDLEGGREFKSGAIADIWRP